MFSDWVTAGGNLIAMRPDKKLASLLGLTDAGTTLGDAYLLVTPPRRPARASCRRRCSSTGRRIGTPPAGATAIATLYLGRATTATRTRR